MPKPHSLLYDDLVQEKTKGKPDEYTEQRLNPAELRTRLLTGDAPLDYEAMSDLLREVNDAQFGIVSTLEQRGKEVQWVRNATSAIPIAERMPHDSPVVEANNTLLRMLSRLRPIDYAFDKKLGTEGSKDIRDAIRKQFADQSEAILIIAQNGLSKEEQMEEIKKKEKSFNTFLVEKLYEANLTQGIENEEQAEKLLFHYRNMSSVLTYPARTLVTLTYDEQTKVLQRETQYPVTKKTELQKQAIEELRTVTPFPDKSEKSGHTKLNHAQQEADSLFVDLIKRDDTALPAQTRKSHLAGAKNAFIVKNELVFDVEQDDIDKPEVFVKEGGEVLWLARAGSPAYVGGGESPKRVEEHAREILEQIRETAKEKMGKDALKIHFTTLNTYTFLENQSTIVNNVRKVTRGAGKGDEYSYLPTNWDGTNRFADVARGLAFDDPTNPLVCPRGSAPSQKATRVAEVSNVMLAAARTEGVLSAVQCASGQDRTGTAIEKTTQDWMKSVYTRRKLTTGNIEEMRAQGGNAAEITTHHVHGSPGMKKESQAGMTFSQSANDQFYLDSANTNKKNKIGKVKFLEEPSLRAREEYDTQLQKCKDACSSFEAGSSDSRKRFKLKSEYLISYIETAGKPDQKPTAKNISELTQVLRSTTKSIEEVNDPQKTMENVKHMANISQNVSGKSSIWKSIAKGLLVVGCAALVCVGVLAAIPSAGTSLFLTAAGIGGFSAAGAIGAGAGAYIGREKDLAKQVSNFKSTLRDMHKETQVEPEQEKTEKDELRQSLLSSPN